MINTTSSNDQNTTTAGSKMWLDDLAVVYNPSSISENSYNANNANVYAFDKNICVEFIRGVKENTVLSVYDLTGKLVVTKQLSNNVREVISFPELNSGLYLYQLTGTEIQKSGKLFIK